MRKLVSLLTILLVASVAFAQKGKVTSATNYKDSGELEKAKNLIEETIDSTNEKSESTITWPRTWEARGEIYDEIYKSGKKIEGVEKPLFVAYDSYIQALNLDEKGRYAKSLKIKFTFLQQNLSNFAVESYNKEKYDDSFECFERILNIYNLPVMIEEGKEAFIDSVIIYNAGLSAYNAKNWDKSIEYYSKAADIDYKGAICYKFIYDAYKAKGDTVLATAKLKEGFSKYPTDENLMFDLINLYIKENNPTEALTYIEKAINDSPKNVSLWVSKGSMLDKLGQEEQAIETYQKAIEVDPKVLTPYFNLSVIYCNKGIKLSNEAIEIPTSEKQRYQEVMKESQAYFEKALPYIEKAYEIAPTEMAVLESLRMVYYRLQMNDKYQEIDKIAKSLK